MNRGPGNMLTIARYTLLEALRNRLLSLTAIAVIAMFGLAEFIGELSITETSQVQAAISASILRVFSITITCVFVISAVSREINDKGLEIILSLPMPRYRYLAGKLFGFAGLSLLISVMAGIPLFLYAPAGPVIGWCLSLCCEQGLMAALSLVCLLAFSGLPRSFLAVMAFYLLSRSMEAITLLSAGPVLTSGTVTWEFMRFMVTALALLLPDLHAFTRSDWLVYGVEASEIPAILIQTLLYLTVLLSGGLFDLYRKNL
ncbi:MAG: ABC transporter permease [Gammaproteobacteria bacterium]|nr:ABC transporter permease [Gammaproteobacteria bacterium]